MPVAAGFVLISQPFGVVTTALVAFPVGLGCGFATAAMLAATFGAARESTMGIVSGLYTASMFIGQFASTPIIALLKSLAGSLSSAILVLGLLAGVLSIIVLMCGIGHATACDGSGRNNDQRMNLNLDDAG